MHHDNLIDSPADTRRMRFYRSPAFVIVSVAAVLFGAGILLFHTGNPIALDDSLRHLIMARPNAEQGLADAEGWGKYFFTGYFARHSSDPWFLSDLFYVPFTAFADGVVGIKIANLALILILLGSFVPILRYYKTSPLLSALFLCALATGSVSFLVRLLSARPFILSIAVFLLTYSVILRKKYILLFPLLAVAVLLSHLFVFPLFLALAAAFLSLLHGRREECARCMLFSALGVALGLWLHPHTANYVHYLSTIFFRQLFVPSNPNVSAEMYSGIFDPDIAIMLVVIALASSFAARKRRRQAMALVRTNTELVLCGALTIVFFFCYVSAARSVDYLFPLLLILLLQLTTITPHARKTTEDFLSSPILKGRKPMVLHGILLIFAITFANVAYLTISGARYNDLNRYSAIEAIPDGSRVLNIDWSVFPALLFLNPSVLYARGMDPHFDDSSALFDATIDRWSWKKGMAELRDRVDWRVMGIHLIRENRQLDVPRWIDDIDATFAPDFLALTRSEHPLLIAALKTQDTVALVAESAEMSIFRFSSR